MTKTEITIEGVTAELHVWVIAILASVSPGERAEILDRVKYWKSAATRSRTGMASAP